MAQLQAHVTFSALTAVGYASAGVVIFGVSTEISILAAIILLIAGLLPDIDGGAGIPARELGGLIAAVAPIAVLRNFPEVHAGGMVRISLVVIASYFLTRLIVVRFLQKATVHRGMIHSVPAAIICGELVYLLYRDVFWYDRMYLAVGAFLGFLSHLLLDAYHNFDLLGKVLGSSEKKPGAMKVIGPTFGLTCILYTGVAVLGWYIAKDFYPNLKLYALLD